MSTVLTEAKLRDTLNLLWEELEKNGMLTQDMDRKGAIENLLFYFRENNITITPEELHTTECKKMLCLALVTETIKNDHPDFGLNYAFMFKKDLTPEEQIEVKNRFKPELKMLLKRLNELNADPKKRLTDDELEFGVEELLKHFHVEENKPSLSQNNAAIDIFAELLSAANKNLYGGIDPSKPGSVATPIYEFFGNLFNITNTRGENLISNAFIDSSNRFDAKEDPLGRKNVIRERLDAISFDSIENDLQSIGIYRPSPHPHLPGSY